MTEEHDNDFVERRDNRKVLEAIGDLKTEMTDRLARIETKQEAIGPRCDAHAERLDALGKTINGNGSMGLAEQVRNLESRNAKQSAAIATGVSFLVIPIWEYVKIKLNIK